ncbi:MAG: DUF1552 domain-containing protein [Bryobacteraceae bacterium]
MIIGKYLSRRTLLRGLGVSIALPVLDSMLPAFAPAKKAPLRMLFNYVPNGIVMEDWTPAAGSSLVDLPRILQPMSAYRDKMMVISGLMQKSGNANGDGPGDHARAAATYLTGVHAKKTQGADIYVGTSMDQVAAEKVGGATRFPSLELTCEDGRMVGGCDSGYSCAYSNSISWRSATTPNPPELNPRAAFERLFGASDEDPETRKKNRRYDRSILDGVMEDTKNLERDLGPSDRRKIDEYMSSVREIEARIQKTETDNKEVVPQMDKPVAAPADLSDHARLMYDLMRVAFQTDMTRIATFMVTREGSSRTYREIDLPEAHHPLTHHQGNPEMIEKVYRINRYHMEMFAEFIGKMAKTPDGDGSLLDHSMIVYGAGLADGNKHEHVNLPVLIAGGACGTIKTGRHLELEKTPINNLYVSMLDRMGVPVESLGDSTGPLRELTEIG